MSRAHVCVTIGIICTASISCSTGSPLVLVSRLDQDLPARYRNMGKGKCCKEACNVDAYETDAGKKAAKTGLFASICEGIGYVSRLELKRVHSGHSHARPKEPPPSDT